jgi:hypothetical protein
MYIDPRLLFANLFSLTLNAVLFAVFAECLAALIWFSCTVQAQTNRRRRRRHV